MTISQNPVLYASVLGSTLDDIERCVGCSMSGDGQVLTDIETLIDAEPGIFSEASSRVVAEILDVAGDLGFGGDVIIYKQ